MNDDPRWIASLACGDEAPAQGKPAVGNWMSCITPGCRRQERIVSVRPFLAAAPEPPRMVQGVLWDRDEVAA